MVVALKIKLITQLIAALTSLVVLLQQNQVLGAITTLSIPAITIPQTATSSLDVIASKLSVTPSISINKNTVSFSATGTYNYCTVEINQYPQPNYVQDMFNLSTTTIKKVYLSGTYPFAINCKMAGKQSGVYKSTIIIP